MLTFCNLSTLDVHGFGFREATTVWRKESRELTRYEKGDAVRLLAQREAEKYPEYHKMIDTICNAQRKAGRLKT